MSEIWQKKNKANELIFERLGKELELNLCFQGAHNLDKRYIHQLHTKAEKGGINVKLNNQEKMLFHKGHIR